jgi:hypothetical protein
MTKVNNAMRQKLLITPPVISRRTLRGELLVLYQDLLQETSRRPVAQPDTCSTRPDPQEREVRGLGSANAWFRNANANADVVRIVANANTTNVC